MHHTGDNPARPASVSWRAGYPGLVWTLAFGVALFGVHAAMNPVAQWDHADVADMAFFGSLALIAAGLVAHGVCAVVDWIRIGQRNGRTTGG